jgi:protein-S-isoprenylcysteine O-methyltransferase Ste14
VPTHVLDTVVGAVWIAFWFYWLVAAMTAKATQSRSMSSLGIRLAIFLLILGSVRSGLFKGQSVTIHNPWLQRVGLAVLLLGLALAVWARIYLGRNWGTPMSQRVEPELVTTGPYHYLRHPIYSGILLGGIGTTMAISLYWLVAVVLFGAYFIYAATVEERMMAQLFPDAYPAYQRATKMLIPFIF